MTSDRSAHLGEDIWGCLPRPKARNTGVGCDGITVVLLFAGPRWRARCSSGGTQAAAIQVIYAQRVLQRGPRGAPRARPPALADLVRARGVSRDPGPHAERGLHPCPRVRLTERSSGA
jgi:hypothetical protein